MEFTRRLRGIFKAVVNAASRRSRVSWDISVYLIQVPMYMYGYCLEMGNTTPILVDPGTLVPTSGPKRKI